MNPKERGKRLKQGLTLILALTAAGCAINNNSGVPEQTTPFESKIASLCDLPCTAENLTEDLRLKYPDDNSYFKGTYSLQNPSTRNSFGLSIVYREDGQIIETLWAKPPQPNDQYLHARRLESSTISFEKDEELLFDGRLGLIVAKPLFHDGQRVETENPFLQTTTIRMVYEVVYKNGLPTGGFWSKKFVTLDRSVPIKFIDLESGLLMPIETLTGKTS